jgi:type IV secretory pathway TrbD component
MSDKEGGNNTMVFMTAMISGIAIIIIALWLSGALGILGL